MPGPVETIADSAVARLTGRMPIRSFSWTSDRVEIGSGPGGSATTAAAASKRVIARRTRVPVGRFDRTTTTVRSSASPAGADTLTS